MRYLTIQQLLLIHSMVIEETGGLHGVRDRSALEAIEALPQQTAFGKEFYADVYTKAAVYARSVIINHPFLDGNKRTGMTAAGVFLDQNAHILDAKEGEIEQFALQIVTKKMGLADIASWFRAHVQASD